MTEDSSTLGRAIGLMLDRDASVESGSATVTLAYDGERENYRCYFRGRSIWRTDNDLTSVRSDGTWVVTWSGDRQVERTPAYPARPPHALQLCFPLRAPIWGRAADDYAMVSAMETADGVRVRLAHMNNGHPAELVVDPESGALLTLRTRSLEMTLQALELGPQSDEMFALGA